MNVIDTINETNKLIGKLTLELHWWRVKFGHEVSQEEANETSELIEEAYQVQIKLKGEQA